MAVSSRKHYANRRYLLLTRDAGEVVRDSSVLLTVGMIRPARLVHRTSVRAASGALQGAVVAGAAAAAAAVANSRGPGQRCYSRR